MPSMFQRPGVLQYTKSITVVVKNLFGYGIIPATSIFSFQCGTDTEGLLNAHKIKWPLRVVVEGSRSSKTLAQSAQKKPRAALLLQPNVLQSCSQKEHLFAVPRGLEAHQICHVISFQQADGYLLRETIIACYKFLTEKCHLKMGRQLSARCYSN